MSMWQRLFAMGLQQSFGVPIEVIGVNCEAFGM